MLARTVMWPEFEGEKYKLEHLYRGTINGDRIKGKLLVREEELPDFFRVSTGTVPPTITPPAGDVDLYLTVSGEKTVITGPVPITTAVGDVLEYISFDTVDPSTADLVLIPLP